MIIKENNRTDDFIKLLWKIYSKKFSNWVPPIKSDLKEILSNNHPFWKHSERMTLFSYNKNEVVGSVTGIIDNNFIRFHNERTAYFGFFECVDDIEVACELFQELFKWLEENEIKKVIGPLNPSTNYECGLVVEGYNSPPKIMMPYNPYYYKKLIENAGFEKAKDLVAFRYTITDEKLERLNRLTKFCKKRNPEITVRTVNLKDFDNEVKKIKEIYESAWEKNWGFVPVSDEEFYWLAKKIKPLIVSDILQIAFFKEEPIGFLMALPDFNEVQIKLNGKINLWNLFKVLFLTKKIKTARLLTLGIKEKYRKIGVDVVLFYNSLIGGLKHNFKEAEFSWILEDNYITINSAINFGGEIYKRYRIYEKII